MNNHNLSLNLISFSVSITYMPCQDNQRIQMVTLLPFFPRRYYKKGSNLILDVGPYTKALEVSISSSSLLFYVIIPVGLITLLFN